MAIPGHPSPHAIFEYFHKINTASRLMDPLLGALTNNLVYSVFTLLRALAKLNRNDT
jgi:hypothetical protein